MYKMHKQETEYTCGPACIRMALSYYTERCPTEQAVIKLANTTEELGTDPDNMATAVRSLGYTAIVKKDCTLLDLCTLSTRTPCIVLYQDQEDSYHYSLVIRIEDDTIILADPYLGVEVPVSSAYFTENWKYSNGTKGWMMLVK